MLTVHEDALTGGSAGVVHSAACGYLHAAQAQLVVALVDAGVLHIELGDAAQGTQDSSARCKYLLSASRSPSCYIQELHAAHARAVLAPGGAGTFAERHGTLCRAPFIQLPAEWLLLHLYGAWACVGFMLLVDTQQTYAIARVCMSFLLWHLLASGSAIAL